ncbi:MAG: pseudouridine-5'-phosphate glycosidase [Chloroflexota bacterium]|nr:pseudouridine-5'-phosphate glycosidase [Chloroflexota bacterium]
MSQGLRIAREVDQALADNVPVVALESALITHGFAPPANLDIARQMQAAVREEGALAATVAVLEGGALVGLTRDELARLASDRTARKVSLRDLPAVLAQGASGGTTVAATMHLARRAGIRVFATGGIGGVHRGHPDDVSADLPALASIPIVVVCAGAKAILDLPRTLEYLETRGVPVIGYGTDEFPAFYSRRSGLGVDVRVETPEEVVQMAKARTELGLPAALLVCVPVPKADELPAGEAETAIAQAVGEADAACVSGKALTPFLLARLVELTGGRARRANEVLLLNNARVAARIAQALATGR